MTLHDASARSAAAREHVSRPSDGDAVPASIVPLSLTRYEVVLGDRPVGYLEAAGPIWVALSGTPYAFAVEVGQHRRLASALRLLTGP